MTGTQKCWLGIDFSGNRDMWGPEVTKSNVWIAEVVDGGAQSLALKNLYPVQNLSGGEHPFRRLITKLETSNFVGAGIDEPFSIPERYLPDHSYRALLDLVGSLDGDPFPRAQTFHSAVTGDRPLPEKKPLRATERHWKSRKVNVRSTLWIEPRGGAPMTAACLKLLHESGNPIWPWKNSAPGLLVEAFPAVQLRQWGMPHQRYNGDQEGQHRMRNTILGGLRNRIELGQFEREMLCSADALDAVLCAFAAIAVSTDNLATEPDPECSKLEGWIAIHK